MTDERGIENDAVAAGCEMRWKLNNRKAGLVRALLTGACLALLPRLAMAQFAKVSPLVIFAGTNGARVTAPLTAGTNGEIYGVTGLGGTNNNGTIFRIDADGNFSSLFSFGTLAPNTNGISTNYSGVGPSVSLALGPDGNFYGMCVAGGTNGYGTIFRVTTNGSFTTLVNFSGTNGLYLGSRSLGTGSMTVGRDGNFYGVSRYGGANWTGSANAGTNGCGTVFRLTVGGTFTTLVNFTGTNGAAPGAEPAASLIQGADGNLYGTTGYGGTNDEGTIFKVTTNGVLTSLFSFASLVTNGDTANGNFGTNYSGSVAVNGLTPGADGSFYGSTAYGGLGGEGTVFRVTTNGAFTTLYSFSPLVTNGTPRATNADGSQVGGNRVRSGAAST